MKKGQVQSDPTEVLPSSNRTTRRQRQPHLEDSKESNERENDGLENEPKEWNVPAQDRGVRSRAGWAGNKIVSEYTKPRQDTRPASRKEETRKEEPDKDSFEDDKDSSEESDDLVGNSRTQGGRGVSTTQPNGENPRSPVGMSSATPNLQPLNNQSFLETKVASDTQKSDTSQLRTITTAVVGDTQHPTTTGVRGDHSTHSHSSCRYETYETLLPQQTKLLQLQRITFTDTPRFISNESTSMTPCRTSPTPDAKPSLSLRRTSNNELCTISLGQQRNGSTNHPRFPPGVGLRSDIVAKGRTGTIGDTMIKLTHGLWQPGEQLQRHSMLNKHRHALAPRSNFAKVDYQHDWGNDYPSHKEMVGSEEGDEANDAHPFPIKQPGQKRVATRRHAPEHDKEGATTMDDGNDGFDIPHRLAILSDNQIMLGNERHFGERSDIAPCELSLTYMTGNPKEQPLGTPNPPINDHNAKHISDPNADKWTQHSANPAFDQNRTLLILLSILHAISPPLSSSLDDYGYSPNEGLGRDHHAKLSGVSESLNKTEGHLIATLKFRERIKTAARLRGASKLGSNCCYDKQFTTGSFGPRGVMEMRPKLPMTLAADVTISG